MIRPIKKILFTTDLSKQTRYAFDYAISLANCYGASLTILYVMEEFTASQSANLQAFIGEERWEDLRQTHEQEARQILIGKKNEGRMIHEALGDMVASTQKDFKTPGVAADEIVVTQGDTGRLHPAGGRGPRLRPDRHGLSPPGPAGRGHHRQRQPQRAAPQQGAGLAGSVAGAGWRIEEG